MTARDFQFSLSAVACGRRGRRRRCGRRIRSISVQDVNIESRKYRRTGRRGCRCRSSSSSSSRSPSSTSTAAGLALAARHCHVLLSVEHERDWRAHAAGLAGGNIQKLLTFIGTERPQAAVPYTLKDEIPGGRDRATANAPSSLRSPYLLLCNHVPCNQVSAGVLRPDHGKRWTGRSRRWRRRSGWLNCVWVPASGCL